jgi:hypothetical protein
MSFFVIKMDISVASRIRNRFGACEPLQGNGGGNDNKLTEKCQR